MSTNYKFLLPLILSFLAFSGAFLFGCKTTQPYGVSMPAQEAQARRPTRTPPSGRELEQEVADFVRVQRHTNTLGPSDVIEIKVIEQPELSGKYEVFADGSIRFPLIGNVMVDSLDPNQVAEIIRSRLADGFLVNPQVSIFVVQRNSKKIFVLGQVAKPGTFTYEDNMTVIQAITMAGGFTARAAQDDASVTRIKDGKTVRIQVPIERIGKGRAPNFVLNPGDIIYVPDSIF